MANNYHIYIIATTQVIIKLLVLGTQRYITIELKLSYRMNEMNEEYMLEFHKES